MGNFRTKLGFNLHDITKNEEESVTAKIIKPFPSENILSKQKVIENELVYKFIWINPDAQNYDISIEIGKIHNRIIEPTKISTKKKWLE